MAEELHQESGLPVPHPNLERYDAAGSLLRALTAPIRLAVIDLLADHAYCVHELVDAIGALECSDRVRDHRFSAHQREQFVEAHSFAAPGGNDDRA